MIVEKASGQAYRDYLRDHILRPFGMTHTDVTDYGTVVPHRVRGYLPDAGGFRNAIPYSPDASFSAGALMSTADDLLRYRHGVFDGVKTAASIRDPISHPTRFADGSPLAYTAGCLITGVLEGHRKISHSGAIDGFTAHYAFYPDDDVTVVVLTNTSDTGRPPVSIEHAVARAVLGVRAPAIKDAIGAPGELERFSGNYLTRPMHFGPDRYGFFVRDGKLWLTYGGVGNGGPEIPLRYQGSGRFVSSLDSEHVFQFDPATGGSRPEFRMWFYDAQFRGIPAD